MSLDIAHCIHCGRIYIRGAELYPVSKKFHLGELKLAEGEKARVAGVEYDGS